MFSIAIAVVIVLWITKYPFHHAAMHLDHGKSAILFSLSCLFRYHTLRVCGSILKDFKWLVELLNNSSAAALRRILIFFSNINHLIDAYQYVTVNSNQASGELLPTVVMFHLITNADIKRAVLNDLGVMNGYVKCVFCSSSLSMGMNLSAIEYIIHYGVPTTADTFLQETGRAAREVGTVGHSILLTFPRMAAGRKLDHTMKTYVKAETCLRETLLTQFNCVKPAGQDNCCDVCDSETTCSVKQAIIDSFESSITDSFSDSLSLASIGSIDDIETV